MDANFVESDPPGIIMCSFNYEDSKADVCCVPCAHRAICKQSARSNQSRCPVCYKLIEKAISGGIEVQIDTASLRTAASLREERRPILTHEEIERITAVATEQAKQDAKREKQPELEELRKRLAQVVFNCGHTACSDYTSLLKSCHICRQPITRKQRIYA